MSKELNLKYKKMSSGLKQIINSWDPYKLIEEGAPDDEFEAEISKVLVGLPKCTTSGEAAKLVSDVFSESFEKKHFSVEDCRSVGDKISSWYKDFSNETA